MLNKTLVYALVLVFLVLTSVINVACAVSSIYESTSVSRIVGSLPNAIDKWDEGVISLVVKDSDKDIVNQAVKQISDAELKGNKLVIFVVEDDAKYIWDEVTG